MIRDTRHARLVARLSKSCYAGAVLLQTMVLTCGAGLGYGLRHAFESDHVAAVTNIVVDGKGSRSAALLGAFWGLGHGFAVVAAGSLLIALDVVVPRSVAFGLELGVVFMLVALGCRSLWRSRLSSTAHPHPHPHERAEAAPGSTRTPLEATLIGLLHGAAGSSALVLLMLTLAPSRWHAAMFLGTFALGATFSMTLLSGLLAAPLGRAMGRWPSFLGRLRAVAGGLSLAAAAFLFVELLRHALEVALTQQVDAGVRAFDAAPTFSNPRPLLSSARRAPLGALGDACRTAARSESNGSAKRPGASTAHSSAACCWVRS